MPASITDEIAKAQSGIDLDAEDVESLIASMLSGEIEDELIGRFLLVLRDKGESVSELVGAARALRKHMTPISSDNTLLIDTCGTGGDGSGTFNISTAAAIVTAAAGVPVAKHGNRAITSKTGSADVLSALGVNVDSDRETVERCLGEAGICFCFAPRLHPAMKHVGAIRRQLGVSTLFNLLGPLCNPAGATHQVLGTGSRTIQHKLAEALRELGIQRAVVVRGIDGLDEVTLSGPTSVLDVSVSGISELEWTPGDFGLYPAGPDAMQAATPDQSAAFIRRILDGEPGPARDIVVANSAASLWLSGTCDDLQRAADTAAGAIDSGRSRLTLDKLVSITSSSR